MDEQGRHQVHNTVDQAVWMVSISHRHRCRSRTARFFTIFLRKSNAARLSDAGRLGRTQRPRGSRRHSKTVFRMKGRHTYLCCAGKAQILVVRRADFAFRPAGDVELNTQRTRRSPHAQRTWPGGRTTRSATAARGSASSPTSPSRLTSSSDGTPRRSAGS